MKRQKLQSDKLNIKVFFDGSTRPNPGPSGCGWCVIHDTDKATDGEEILHGYHYIGDHQTNNEAEYGGIIEVLGVLVKHQDRIQNVTVCGDSKLVISQVFGNWKCNFPHLIKLRDTAKGLCKTLKQAGIHVKAIHVDRKYNARADSLANEAVDLKETKISDTTNTLFDLSDT